MAFGSNSTWRIENSLDCLLEAEVDEIFTPIPQQHIYRFNVHHTFPI